METAAAPPDQKARDLARLDLASNVVVEAGAGTGKTTLLTDRLLFLLLGGPRGAPVPIGAIVALTFTEKAAGEIKLRLSDRLSELGALLSGEALREPARARAAATLDELKTHFEKDEAKLLERARAVLEDLDKAQIGTIHSFAAHLLRLYPLQAGVDPGFSVDEGEGFEELFASEWARWLDAELGEKPPRSAAWLDVLALCALDDLESLARELCRERLELDAASEPDPETAAWLEALARDLTRAASAQPPPRGNSKIVETVAALTKHLKELAAAAKTPDPSLPQALSTARFTAAWPKAWDPAPSDLYQRAVSVAEAASAGSESVVRRASRLLLPFARSFRKTYTRRGLVSFDGLLMKARDLVRDHPEVRDELKHKFAALLIDEFQDTDPLQGELLLYLAEAPGGRARSWSEVRPGPGRLFVVGDPKQSIYRFRGADLQAYQSFTRRVLEDRVSKACDLQANFRSPAAILEPVNAVFGKLMREVEGLQAAHKRLEAGRPDDAVFGASVELVAVSPPERADAPAAAVQRAEASWIASWVLQHCGPGRELGYKDVAVLLRASSPLPVLLETFKSAGVPYAVEMERYFYGAQEIVDFLNLLRALDDPSDRAALAGVLRSPLGGLDDRRLYELSREGALNYLKKPPASCRDITALFAALNELRAFVGRRPLGQLVAAVLERTRLLELSAAAYHGQQTVSNLLKLARLAEGASQSRGDTLREFIERVSNEMKESAREGESPLADEHLDAVRVLTIHKAKGLEFPVVFLTNAASGRRGGRRAGALLDWSSARAGLRVGDLAANAAMARLEAAEDARQEHESVRLLYVAMTRARRRLFVLGKEKGDKKAFTALLAAAGLWPDGAPGVSARKAPVDAAPPAGAARRGTGRGASPPAENLFASLWSERERRRDAASALRMTTSPTDYLKEPAKPRPRDDERRELPALGALVGQLCHRVLQRWDFRSGGRLVESVAAAADALERLEPAADWDAVKAEAGTVLEKFLASNAARELGQAEIVGRELAFIVEEGGAVMRGSIDLLYRGGGKLVVADYKTDRVTAKSAKGLRERYAMQGAAYCSAVKTTMGVKEVDFRVIFLRAPEL